MKLSTYRKTKGLTQEQFAKLVKCSQARISEIETGVMPGFSLAVRISEATDGKVPVTEWLSSSNDTPAQADQSGEAAA